MNNIADEPAFPFVCSDISKHQVHDPGMTKREYLASKAPQPPPEWWLKMRRERQRLLNPHNDSYKPPILGEVELMAVWAVEYADALLTQLSNPVKP
jgi:hypothetical protein